MLFEPDTCVKRTLGSKPKDKTPASTSTDSEKSSKKRTKDEEGKGEAAEVTKRPRTEGESKDKKDKESPSSSGSSSGPSSAAQSSKPIVPVKFPTTCHPDLILAYNLVYEPNGIFCTSRPLKEAESEEYGAHDLGLNNFPVKFRAAKITPTKNGQFVTLWKRDTKTSPIRPYDMKDSVELFIVSVRAGGSHFGQFVFPKSVLAQRDIVSKNGKGGKRAIRVYPPWVKPESRQAATTQDWQLKYYLSIPEGGGKKLDLTKVRRFFAGLLTLAKKV